MVVLGQMRGVMFYASRASPADRALAGEAAAGAGLTEARRSTEQGFGGNTQRSISALNELLAIWSTLGCKLLIPLQAVASFLNPVAIPTRRKATREGKHDTLPHFAKHDGLIKTGKPLLRHML